MVGFGALWLAVIFFTCIALAVARPRVFAPVIGGLGLLLCLYLVASLAFNWSFPYRTWNISIYVVFFFAVIFTVSGGIGGLILLIRRLTQQIPKDR